MFYCFFFEMVIKIIGLGQKEYVRDKFNIFDGFIVIVSTVEFVIDQTQVSTSKRSLINHPGVSSGGAVSAFRAIRLLRIFKLARQWKSF